MPSSLDYLGFPVSPYTRYITISILLISKLCSRKRTLRLWVVVTCVVVHQATDWAAKRVFKQRQGARPNILRILHSARPIVLNDPNQCQNGQIHQGQLALISEIMDLVQLSGAEAWSLPWTCALLWTAPPLIRFVAAPKSRMALSYVLDTRYTRDSMDYMPMCEHSTTITSPQR